VRRVGQWEGAQKYLIDQAEDSCVGADAEREYGGDGEPRAAA
jgi:hypothetical protein